MHGIMTAAHMLDAPANAVIGLHAQKIRKLLAQQAGGIQPAYARSDRLNNHALECAPAPQQTSHAAHFRRTLRGHSRQ